MPGTVSNTYTQVAWAQSCAKSVQHIECLSRETKANNRKKEQWVVLRQSVLFLTLNVLYHTTPHHTTPHHTTPRHTTPHHTTPHHTTPRHTTPHHTTPHHTNCSTESQDSCSIKHSNLRYFKGNESSSSILRLLVTIY